MHAENGADPGPNRSAAQADVAKLVDQQILRRNN